MKKYCLTCLAFLLCITQNAAAQGTGSDYDSFRKQVLSDYAGFRQSVLDDYIHFLEGIWKDYTSFTGMRPPFEPKPKSQPKATPQPKKEPIDIKPNVVDQPEPTKPKPAPQPNVPKPLPTSPTPGRQEVKFTWYGADISLPSVNITERLQEVTPKGVATFWTYLNNTDLYDRVVPRLIALATANNLNDWCIFQIIGDYGNVLQKGADQNSIEVLRHYLLTAMGYDVRLAISDNCIFLLLPFGQMVYARSYIILNDTKYYIFGHCEPTDGSHFYTSEIPANANTGRSLDLVIRKPINLPRQDFAFSHTFGKLNIKGQVNQNLIKWMNTCPQMPIPSYAASVGDESARRSVLSQLKEQIKGMSETEAANALLWFIQSYDYATDDAQFGYEKPFFVEETLYYPKCDCEDRAIFYRYLVTNLLGLDVHLVHFPNHECTAVHFNQDVNGDGYMYNGKKYLICDPTYIGASIGNCMPDFRNVQPEVELVKE